MSSLYFGLAVFCLLEAGVPEFTRTPPPPSSVDVQSVHCINSGTLSSNGRTHEAPKIQQWHLFADLAKSHLWYLASTNSTSHGIKEYREIFYIEESWYVVFVEWHQILVLGDSGQWSETRGCSLTYNISFINIIWRIYVKTTCCLSF